MSSAKWELRLLWADNDQGRAQVVRYDTKREAEEHAADVEDNLHLVAAEIVKVATGSESAALVEDFLSCFPECHHGDVDGAALAEYACGLCGAIAWDVRVESRERYCRLCEARDMLRDFRSGRKPRGGAKTGSATVK